MAGHIWSHDHIESLRLSGMKYFQCEASRNKRSAAGVTVSALLMLLGENMETIEAKKCAQPACQCTVMDQNRYCSQCCKDSKRL